MSQETLSYALAAACSRWATRPSLDDGTRSLCYERVGQEVARLARLLDRTGVRQGDRVLSRLPNRVETLVTVAATWTCGAIYVGMDPDATDREVTRVMQLLTPTAIVHERGTTPYVSGSHQPEIVISGRNDHQEGFDRVSADVIQGRAPAPDDPACIFLSSGTGGWPKPALGLHGNLANRWRGLAEWLAFVPDDVHLGHLPLSHGFGLMMSMACLLSGGRLVLVPSFSAREVLTTIQEQQVTVLHGTPTHFRLILQEIANTGRSVESLRTSVGTGSSFSPDLVDQIRAELGVRFVAMYGSSEGVGVATDRLDDILLGSVGRPPAGSVCIMGPDGHPLPAGQVGEVAFSRSAYPVKYWVAERAAPEARALSPHERWYHTGDLGYVDNVGRLYIHGRSDRMIDRGGILIDPIEIEDLLLRFPEVKDAAVVGMPDKMLGHYVCAVITSRVEETNTVAIQEGLRRVLAPHKMPADFQVVPRIPRTSLGKLDVRRLVETVIHTRSENAEDGVLPLTDPPEMR